MPAGLPQKPSLEGLEGRWSERWEVDGTYRFDRDADRPVYAIDQLLRQTGVALSDVGLFEINEAFAVQVLAFLDHFGVDAEDPRVNPYGGAIALGHPLASSGVRLMIHLARAFRVSAAYGLARNLTRHVPQAKSHTHTSPR